MEIRDIIHGAIAIEPWELPVLDSPYFQRLRQIKQMGFAEHSFPSATHNRYIHSLGAMDTATTLFRSLFSHLPLSAYARFRTVVRFAALLHDVGHGPLSHTTEIAMPPVRDLNLHRFLSIEDPSRKATHEDYTLKMILDSGLTPLLEQAGQAFGVKAIHIASLVHSGIDTHDDFFREKVTLPETSGSEVIDFRPILKQLISSELDADRMDYLRRDSLQAGVSYGQFDFDWLVSNLTSHYDRGKCYLALHHRAIYTFEDFLISRFHMFLMVYFHHKSVIFDEMLAQYFSSPDCDYRLPAQIEEYCHYHDAHLTAHLAQSSNLWAKRIMEQKPYRMLIEVHSGIPTSSSAQEKQLALLQELESNLRERGIHVISAQSTGELSKYFRRPGDPIFVKYDNHFSEPKFIPLEECTDLFEKYRDKRRINRLYVSPEDYLISFAKD